MRIAVLRRRRRRIGAAAITPSQIVAVPYQKIVVGEAYSYSLGPHYINANTFSVAPGSTALPAGVTLAANGDLAGPATAAAMNLVITVRATNTASGLYTDDPFDLSAAQRPTALAAPVLSEPSAGVLRVAKPTIPANTPAVDHVDILYGLVNPPTLANATLVVDAFPVAATTFDIPDQAPGSTIYVTTRSAVAWGDGSFLYPSPQFSANVASRLIATPIVNSAPVGANKALDFNIPAPDTTAPTLLSSSPADNATGVAPSATVTLTFSEAIALSAAGTVTIREDAGTGFADWEVFDLATDKGAGAGKISASGAEVLLTPTIPMVAGRSYAVRVSAGAVKDTAGNAFAGIADDTTLNFAVAASAAYFTNGSAYFTDKPATTTAGNNGQWVTRQKVRLADASTGILYSFAGSQGTLDIRAGGALRITMSDSASNVRLNGIISVSGVVTTGVWLDIVSCADLVAGTFKVWVNGVLKLDLTMAAFAPTTFQTTRDIFLLAATSGATPVTGDVEIMQFFKNQITTDGNVSGLTPYKTIQGNAATVMADSWYQGGTAT